MKRLFITLFCVLGHFAISAQHNSVYSCEYVGSCEEKTAVKTLVYPNPSNDIFYFSQIENVVMFNSAGQKMYEGQTNEVNAAGWGSGVYILKVLRGPFFFKLVKI